MRDFLRKFKFEAKWHLDEEYDQIMEEAWKEEAMGDSGIQMMQNKLATCQTAVTGWNERKYGDARKILKQETKALEELQREEGPKHGADIACLKKEIEFIMEQEDTKWKQRAMQNWYQKGDRNTPFFMHRHIIGDGLTISDASWIKKDVNGRR